MHVNSLSTSGYAEENFPPELARCRALRLAVSPGYKYVGRVCEINVFVLLRLLEACDHLYGT